MKRKLKKIFSSKLVKILLVLAITFVGYRLVVQPRASTTKKEIVVEKPIETKPAKATAEVNKSFEFETPVIDGKGTEEVTFTIVSAELKDQIKVQGKIQEATKGQLYLLLRLEIENETSNKLAFTSNDYIRLVDAQEKKYSPDFHNATVIIDPLSVRKDLISFIVDGKAKNFKFLVGELEEEKETVEINF